MPGTHQAAKKKGRPSGQLPDAEKVAAIRAYATLNIGRDERISRHELALTLYAIVGDWPGLRDFQPSFVELREALKLADAAMLRRKDRR